MDDRATLIMLDNDLVSEIPVPRGEDDLFTAHISQDGSTVVAGQLGDHFIRWNANDFGESPLSIPARTWGGIQGMSHDGKVFITRQLRWSEQDGVQSFGNDEDVDIWGISSDERWAVGSIEGESGLRADRIGTRWDGLSPPQHLLPFDEAWGTTGIDVSADGSIVVGRLYLGEVPLERRTDLAAGIWTEQSNQMMPLQQLLNSHYGLSDSLHGYNLTGIYDITDNGRYMVGHAINPDGDGEAFYLDLGLRGDFNGDEMLDINDLNALSSAIQENDPNLKFDLNYSNAVAFEDQRLWVKELKQTFFGDANLDGEFNSSDLVVVFDAGQYEDGIAGNSNWATGNWNGDAEFSTSDLVLAFQDGGYEQGPLAVASAVPEPPSLCLFLLGGGFLARGRRRSQ
jgi:hypothetical protein